MIEVEYPPYSVSEPTELEFLIQSLGISEQTLHSSKVVSEESIENYWMIGYEVNALKSISEAFLHHSDQ